MTIRHADCRSAIPGRTAHIVAILCAALAAGGATAQEFPTLRAGLWELRRTVEAPAENGAPQTMLTTECTSPNEGMVARQEILRKIGCTLSPLAHSANTYTFSAVCGEGADETMKSVLTVESDSAYSIRIDSTSAGTQSQELLRATRVGDCQP